MTRSTGKLADPEFRQARALKAARARTSVEHHIEKLVEAAPALTPSQRDQLAALLRPSLHDGPEAA
ncbi:hypothetical protein [Kribbella sp.]|uniref:hypothetical protein n=1 Tax=Kribbella sp. TaxID=1871183 RepID=UPI002D69D3D2|nr:hypothetical protein [Kribbella sp.]HZX05680.1 hypothetical protein [Kribbella sp.]